MNFKKDIKTFFEKYIFCFKDIDVHYVLILFGNIQISIKHKSKFKYQNVIECGINELKRTPQLIVSLTSYPGRISSIHKVISTLLNQTLKPDKLVLWLTQEEFPQREKNLPIDLLKLCNLGLEIKWCENLKSFKKLIPALREYPNDIIVTADDDMYYEKDWLECLYLKYLECPAHIYVHRISRLILTNNNIKTIPLKKSYFMDFSKPSYLNSLFGGSGCLYPPNSLSEEVLNIEKIKKIAPTNDDIWFWAMAVMNKTKIVEVSGLKRRFNTLDEYQGTGLYRTNTHEYMLKTYQKILEEYPNIYYLLEQEMKNDTK